MTTPAALGSQFRKDMLDYQFGGNGQTYYVSIHADDPADDGGGGLNEFTGSGYARAPVAPEDWAAAISYGGGIVKATGVDIPWPEATGNWAGGSFPAVWLAVWKHATSTSEANFVGRVPVPVEMQSVIVTGNVPYIPAGTALYIGLGDAP